MRKIFNFQFSIFYLLLVIFAFYILRSTFYIAPAYAAGATLSLSPATGTFNKGCPFSLDIILNTGGVATDGTDAILFYDSSRFTAQTIRNGTIYSDYTGNNIDSTQGKITVSGMTAVGSTYSGTGTLATIDFLVSGSAPAGATQITFDFDPNDKAKTTDSNVAVRTNTSVYDILDSVVNGTYTIGSGTTCTGGGGTISPTPIGGGGGGSGGGGGGGVIITKTPPELPKGGDINTTVMLSIAGTLLTILGVIGLALL